MVSSKKSVGNSGRKKSTSGKTTKIRYESTKEIKFEKALVDNFIALQKVMVNLASKFDSLSAQISKLLELFEISAKSLAQKEFESGKGNKEFEKISEKLTNLTEQAGLIGRGLALIHETNYEKVGPENSIPNTDPKFNLENKQFQPSQRQIPNQIKSGEIPGRMQKPLSQTARQLGKQTGESHDQYQKSIASGKQESDFPVSKEEPGYRRVGPRVR